MADQKKWFKVWASLVHDAKFQTMNLQDIGLWTLLLAMTATDGERGKLLICPPATITLALLRQPNLKTLKMAISRLPNVHLGDNVNANGDFYVIISKWFKYQVDFTAYDRVKRSRYKKRSRQEEMLTSTSTSTSPASRRAALAPLGAASRLPLAGKVNTKKEADMTTEEMEEAEQRERNNEWRKELPMIPKSERMTPEEMKAIRIKNFGYYKHEKPESQIGGKT